MKELNKKFNVVKLLCQGGGTRWLFEDQPDMWKSEFAVCSNGIVSGGLLASSIQQVHDKSQ